MKLRLIAVGLFVAIAGCVTVPPPTPTAVKRPETTTLHGVTRTDNYAYFKDRKSPEMIAHLTSENAYAEHHLKPLQPLADAVYAETLSHIQQTDDSVPYRDGRYLYYTRIVEGQQYGVYCRKPLAGGPEEILLNVPELAKAHSFFDVGGFEVSDDGLMLAYSVDRTGFREYALYLKDLGTGKTTGPLMQRVSSFTFGHGATLYAVTDDDAKRPHLLHRIASGKPPVQLFEETSRQFNLGVGRTRSREFVVVTSGSADTSEVRLLPAGDVNGAPRVVVPRRSGVEYYVEHRPGTFYIWTNDSAKTFRVVTAPESDPAAWTEMVPARPDVAITGLSAFKNHLVIEQRRGGLPGFTVIDFARRSAHDISFDEPTYSADPAQNAEFNTERFRFSYTSFTTPSSVFDYDLNTRGKTLLKRQPVPGFDPDMYAERRIFAAAADGTSIPVSLVYRKDRFTEGRPGPVYLSAYGSYGIPNDVYFSPTWLPLLDRGVVVALAHIRGGGEFGKPWHDAGKLMTKKNTFTDFIASAEHLIAAKYTTPDKLVINGGSAGGLLMGAVLNLRPELFRAALVEVPFVDVTNTMLDDTLPLTTQEYLEWGNPNEPEAFAYINSYSPYDNLRAAAYPSILVRTSLNDSQVLVHEPAKWTAKLRDVKTDANPVLMLVSMDAGHGGSSGRYDSLKESSISNAWVLSQLGINK